MSYNNFSNLISSAMTFLQQGDWENTIETCDELIRIQPNNVLVYEYRLMAEAKVKSLYELSRIKETLVNFPSYNKVIELAPEGIRDLIYSPSQAIEPQVIENATKVSYSRIEEDTVYNEPENLEEQIQEGFVFRNSNGSVKQSTTQSEVKSNETKYEEKSMPQQERQTKFIDRNNALICDLCQSNNIIKVGGLFECQSCGTKYTVEEARRMLSEESVDVSGSTVKVDTSDELRNLYQIARRARHDGNNEKAQQYYDQITVKDPSSWEASFYSTYYQSMNCKIAEIGAAANRVIGCERTVLNLIKDNLTDQKEQSDAVRDVSLKLMSISTMLFNSYKSFYDGLSASLQSEYLSTYVRNCGAARDIVYYGGDQIIWTFGETYSDLAVSCWKAGVIKDNILNCGRYNEGTNSYNQKIVKYDPSYKAPEMKKGGCYIATSVYGSYNCPQVWTLRRYRDYELAKTWYGRAFIKIYYTVSPTFVNWFGDTEWFKNMWRRKLDKMVTDLKKRGFDDTPYEDRFY